MRGAIASCCAVDTRSEQVYTTARFPGAPMGGKANRRGPPNVEQQNFFAGGKEKFDAAVSAEIGFVERLVWFWSNHFCVSADNVYNMCGGYEREAIRAHVL